MRSSGRPTQIVRFFVASLLLVGSALVAGIPQAHAVDQVPWVADMATAMRIAASRNQLVLLHFTSDNCVPCRRLETNVFSDAIFGRSVAEAYVPVKINVTLNPDLARRFQVTAWPTDIIVAPDGHEVHRMVSQQDTNQYLNILRQVAWGYQSQPNEASLASTRTSDHAVWPPAQSGAASLAASVTPSVGNQPFAPTYGNDPYAAANMPPARNPAPNVQAAPLEMDNNYVQGVSYAGPASPPPGSPAPPAYVAGSPNPASAPMPNAPPTYAPPSAVPPPYEPGIPPAMPTNNNNIGQSTTGPMAPSGSGTGPYGAAQASYGAPSVPVQAPSTQLAPPDLSAKPAMEGFCPVAVMDEDRWATGDSRWGARHRGRVYLFHDAASQQRFMGDPERYSPALAGFDPVLFSEHGQFVEGKREHGLRFENQMFLFNSEESLAKFEKNPDAYAGQVRQAVLGSTQYR